VAGQELAAEPATGFKKKSGWVVPRDSCPIDAAKRDWPGKKSITTRFRSLAGLSIGSYALMRAKRFFENAFR